jgi:hypothetical protein
MGEKRRAKWAAALDATVKKEKASGWARSTITNADLKKFKKAGMISEEDHDVGQRDCPPSGS